MIIPRITTEDNIYLHKDIKKMVHIEPFIEN